MLRIQIRRIRKISLDPDPTKNIENWKLSYFFNLILIIMYKVPVVRFSNLNTQNLVYENFLNLEDFLCNESFYSLDLDPYRFCLEPDPY